jgi:hypothetical protein
MLSSGIPPRVESVTSDSHRHDVAQIDSPADTPMDLRSTRNCLKRMTGQRRILPNESARINPFSNGQPKYEAGLRERKAPIAIADTIAHRSDNLGCDEGSCAESFLRIRTSDSPLSTCFSACHGQHEPRFTHGGGHRLGGSHGSTGAYSVQHEEFRGIQTSMEFRHPLTHREFRHPLTHRSEQGIQTSINSSVGAIGQGIQTSINSSVGAIGQGSRARGPERIRDRASRF